MSDRKLGMLIDLSRCVGCNACVVGCKQENGVPIGDYNTWIESWDVDENGRVKRANLPKLCNQCDNPSCVAVCPTGASYVSGDGTVQVDKDKCIGCKYCMSACPYGVRYATDEGDIRKCTFCQHRTSNGLLPVCVSTCITQARIFGDLNDPDSDISKALKSHGHEVLMTDMGLSPKVFYIGLDKYLNLPRVSAIHKGGNVMKKYDGRL